MKKQYYFLKLLVIVVCSLSYGQVQKTQTLQIGNTSANTYNTSAALQIDDTSRGLLVPRMNVTQRDAIASPANALLIYNTTNNSFEVYKNSCNCWVTVYDGGSNPASSLVNTPPTANNLSYSGNFIQGQTVTLNYTYSDAQNDPQGLTSFVWQRASTSAGTDAVAISNATSANYILQSGDIGMYVRAVVFPRASSGVLNGTSFNGSWTLVESNNIPKANNLTVSGTPAIGSVLSANYTFSGGNGTEDVSLTGTTYVWQSATSNNGDGINNVSLYNDLAYKKNYTPQNDLLGKYIRVGVKAKDTNALQAYNFSNSPWIGPLTAALEAAPTVNNVIYSPNPAVGVTVTGSYNYFDVNYDPEGASIFKWYRADTASGSGAVAITGATSKNYTITNADSNKYIGFGVTPKALTGTTTGTEVIYYNTTAVLPIAAFTFTSSNPKQLPFFSINKTMNTQNAIQIEVNVTSPGGLSITAPAVNGYSFSSSFTLSTGTQWLTLLPTGVQTTYNSVGDNIVLTGVGQTTQTKTINIYNTKTGAALTTHYNGWVSGTNATPNATTYTVGETFNNNSDCINQPISISACPSGNTVTGASGTVYPTVLINGQCWMQKNLKEIPSNYASVSSTTFTANVDFGGWGYYNTTTLDGSAGFATTEQVANYGMLYYWNAAMNGTTYERSQGVCPSGWHVPSDCEWRYLEHGLGLTLALSNSWDWNRNSTNLSGKLRSEGTGFTNTSGFSAYLSGQRETSSNGAFSAAGVDFFMHTSTTSGSAKIFRRAEVTNGVQSAILRTTWPTIQPASLRCLKD